MPRGVYTGHNYRPMKKPVMTSSNDDWMALTYGGPRTSPYQEPVRQEPEETWIERLRREAAEFKRRRIDRIIENE